MVLKSILVDKERVAPSSWKWMVFPALFLLTVLSRLPFLSNLGSDEVFYLIVGRQWLEGLPPYIHTFDVKPPLLFVLMAASELVFGPTLLAAKALTMLAVSLSASGLYLIGRRFVGALAGLVAAVFYIIASLSLEGTFSPAELLFAPFAIWGILLALPVVLASGRAGAGRSLVLSGLCFGAAVCIKHTAVFDAMPLALFLLVSGRSFLRGIKTLTFFALGGCIVPVGFALYFAAKGHFGVFFADVVISAFGRAGAPFVPWPEAFVRLSAEVFFILPLAALASAAWLSHLDGQARKVFFARLFFSCWALTALCGVLATRAMLFFYMLTILPPMCLLAGLAFQHSLSRSRAPLRMWGARTVAAFVVLGYFAISIPKVALPSGDTYEAGLQAAAFMHRIGLGKDQPILVADRDSVVYLTTGANPPTRIFNQMHFLCDFPIDGAEQALDEAVRHRPSFIVQSDPPSHLGCEKPNRRDVLDAALQADYCPLRRFGSTWTGGYPGGFIVYGLKPKSNAPC